MLLKRLGTVKSIELFHHRERVFPIVMVIIPYVFTLLLLIRLQVPEIFIKIVQGGILAMIIAATVSYWWKISLHMVGIGGVTGFIIAGLILHYFTSLNLLVVVVVLSGLLASARLVRGDHCPSQVYTGYLTGLPLFCWYLALIACRRVTDFGRSYPNYNIVADKRSYYLCKCL